MSSNLYYITTGKVVRILSILKISGVKLDILQRPKFVHSRLLLSPNNITLTGSNVQKQHTRLHACLLQNL